MLFLDAANLDGRDCRPGQRVALRGALAGLLAAALAGSAGCGVGVADLEVTRGSLSYHLDRQDCTVHYTGVAGYAATTVDLNCPVDLQPSSAKPALLLSLPLTAQAGSVPLQDPQYGDFGYMPGQFLVVTYRDSGQTITCDMRQATGAVNYLAVPRYGSAQKSQQRLAGSFSTDAALTHCMSDSGPSAGGPLTISGHFDFLVP